MDSTRQNTPPSTVRIKTAYRIFILSSLLLPHAQAAEAHEAQRHEAGGDQRDGKAPEGLRRVGELQPLPDAGEEHDGQQEAHAAGDAVDHGLDEVLVLLDA